MRNDYEGNGRSGRRRFLAAAGSAAAGAFAAVRLGAGPAWAAPKPKTPPPQPGDPPDKIGASGITVKPNDPAISASSIEFPGLITPIQAYVASPVGGETYPGILMLHDADGLTEHARDIARRLAKVGYVALVPDQLSREGGTAKFSTVAQVSNTMTQIAIPQFLQDANTAVRYLEAYPLAAKTRIGVLALGLGGVFSWFLLAENSDLRAGAIYYGGVPNFALIPRMTAAVLAIFGDGDGHDPNDLKDLDAAMKKADLPWSYKIETKAGRDFFDDTRKAYAPAAAKDAWKLTLDWYKEHLTG
jgi:carboxymethylenebutenolidase